MTKRPLKEQMIDLKSDMAGEQPISVPEKPEVKEPEVEKPAKTMGRPKSKPESRQTSFHLAVSLIEKIDAEVASIEFCNKSGLVSKILEEHFSNKGK